MSAVVSDTSPINYLIRVDRALDLGPGEMEAIALAKEIGDTLLLIDERQGEKGRAGKWSSHGWHSQHS